MTVDTSSADDSTVGAGAELLSIEAAVVAAEAVLAHRFGSAITLVDAEDLEGSGPATVVRARVASSPFALPRTLVIKHYPERPMPGETDSFAREAASYQLFTALSPEERVCPELLAHDRDHRVLVIDDLGRTDTLEDKLNGSDGRAAETALLSWARSLGRMHFSTANREADFNALLRRLSAGAKGEEQPRQPDQTVELVAACEQLPPLLRDVLGVPTPEAAHDALGRALDQARSPSYRAFSPVDLWPDNNLVTSAGVRFLDFERGRIRSALVDAAHLRVPFASGPKPLALPSGMSEAMIAAWRAEVVALWPGLADEDTLSSYLLDNQLLLVSMATVRLLPRLLGSAEFSASGPASALVTWWRDLTEYAGREGEDGVADHADTVTRALAARFGRGLALPLYPAFR
ncbi:phosphotransferase [Saccharomonospora sp. NPDC006951]